MYFLRMALDVVLFTTQVVKARPSVSTSASQPQEIVLHPQ